VLIALAGVLIGCAQRSAGPTPRIPTKAEYDRVAEGMTLAEVDAILGEARGVVEKADMPEEVQAAWKEDVWRWGGRRQFGKEVRVYFKDGKVSRKDSFGL